MSNTAQKRKNDGNDEETVSKRSKTASESDVIAVPEASVEHAVLAPASDEHERAAHTGEPSGHAASNDKGKEKADARKQPTESHANPSKPTHTIRKLAPQRPFPTVPTSVSATGPRSAHTEGKNYICVTRKTPMGAYLRRCKDVVLKDGYKSLHLSAMGAAIPHLMQLALSLPAILPFAQDEIHTEVLTGTVEVQDEMIPEDEDEDITYRTRGKSTVSVVIKIGDGVDETIRRGKARGKGIAAKNTVAAAGGNAGAGRASHSKDKAKKAPPQTVIGINAMETT